MSALREAIRRHAIAMPAALALRGASAGSSGAAVTFSYRELDAVLTEREIALRRTGARVLALSADNSPEWVITDLAARAAGIVVVPIPQFFSPSQKLHALADSGADLVIASEREVRGLMLDACPARAEASVIDGCPAWHRNLSASTAGIPAGTAKISYTSGTTGRPKGVCISHAATDAVAGSLVAATHSLALSRHLCLLPLPTLLENIAGNDAPLLAGGEVVVPGLAELGWTGTAGLDFGRLTRLVSAVEPHSIILVPEVLRGLLAAVAQGWRPPASLRFVAVGGGRVAPALLERAERCGLPVYEGYGLTECASVVALNTPEGRRRGSVGRPLAHARVRISDKCEIRVGGPSVSAYLGGPPVKREVATGDLGFFDDDGYLYVHGRSRNVFINSFGRNVSPDWIEPEFLRHRAIRQIAVFGEARPWNVAVIVGAPDASAEEIAAAVDETNATLPDYAQVADWLVADAVFSLDNGLMTGNGRTRRDAVLDVYRDRIETRYGKAAGPLAAGQGV